MQAQKSAAFHRAFTKADLCEYYVNLEAKTFDTFKVEPSLMTVFEQSYTWDELIRHFVDTYVVETDKKAVSSFYDRGYIAERLKGLETELALECRITLNGEERWVRNVVIRGEIEDSEDVYKRQVLNKAFGRCFYEEKSTCNYVSCRINHVDFGVRKKRKTI